MDLAEKASQRHFIQQKFGHVTVYALESPALLYIQANGYIGPSLLQETLELARGFGKQHSNGWDYIVDTIGVKIANPLNVFWLRRIHKLPNLRRYIVITPAFFLVRMLIPLVSFLVRPDVILTSKEELNRLYDFTD